VTDKVCPHSNKFKRLRWIAKRLAEEPDVLKSVQVKVVRWVPDSVGKGTHLVETKKVQPFWQYGCAKRIYKDMKRDGWGGTIERLEKLVAEVMNVKETKRI